jgi:hypothetical protein
LELATRLKQEGRLFVCTARRPQWLFKNGINQFKPKSQWKPGDFIWRRNDEGIVAMSWKDSTLVNLLSYGFSPFVVFNHKRKKRRQSYVESKVPLIAKIYRESYHALGKIFLI